MCSGLNAGRYALRDALKKIVKQYLYRYIVEDDKSYFVEIADGLVNYYRNKKKFPVDWSATQHKCK